MAAAALRDRFAAQLKKLGDQTSNPEQKRRVLDAFRDLEAANKSVVSAADDYLGDPDSTARQNELHEVAACAHAHTHTHAAAAAAAAAAAQFACNNHRLPRI